MSTKTQTTIHEFECSGCKEKLPLGTKNCKWCGTYIPNPPTTPIVVTSEKKSLLGRMFKK